MATVRGPVLFKMLRKWRFPVAPGAASPEIGNFSVDRHTARLLLASQHPRGKR